MMINPFGVQGAYLVPILFATIVGRSVTCKLRDAEFGPLAMTIRHIFDNMLKNLASEELSINSWNRKKPMGHNSPEL